VERAVHKPHQADRLRLGCVQHRRMRPSIMGASERYFDSIFSIAVAACTTTLRHNLTNKSTILTRLLTNLVTARMPEDPEPLRDVVSFGREHVGVLAALGPNSASSATVVELDADVVDASAESHAG
jgi:hypothetical protein